MCRGGEKGDKNRGAEPQGVPRLFCRRPLRGGLKGTEVKSIRAGTLNLKDSYVIVKNGEANVLSMHISPYDKGNIFNHDPDRPKKLLLHKREINKLYALVKQDGYALIPLSVYFKDARVKVEVGVCKGKKNYDKREDAAKRDAKREIDRAMKARR